MKSNIEFYSKEEIELFSSLGYDDLMPHVEPQNLYRIAALKCFINRENGGNVEALRRGCKALEECKIFRMTDRFNDLIDFKEYPYDHEPMMPCPEGKWICRRCGYDKTNPVGRVSHICSHYKEIGILK